MNILLIGSGGREHALAWKIAASPLTQRLYCAPGNAGIAHDAECVALDAADHAAVIAFCRDKAIGLVVVGPEAPLVAGLVDDLAGAGIKAFGPAKLAARLEGSKGFTKDLCRANGIPTAAYERFTDAAAAKAYIRKTGAPIVVKADGLAAGKGVVVAMSLAEAEVAVDAILDTPAREPEAGQTRASDSQREPARAAVTASESRPEVVIEEFLEGEEASFFVLTDGETALPLASAQDHKRAFDGDEGPNTGGMGAYSPAPVLTPALERRALDEIIHPTLRAMKAAGCPYRGVLYAGLMITAKGPQLIEYNARFGDPECQVLMVRLMSDLVPALLATVDGQLSNIDLRWYPEPALTVVMAAKGYPGDYEKGTHIEGLGEASAIAGVQIFHAGTTAQGDHILAAGGRVLGVTASGGTLAQARERAYAAIDNIHWPQGFCRRDIGHRALAREGE